MRVRKAFGVSVHRPSIYGLRNCDTAQLLQLHKRQPAGEVECGIRLIRRRNLSRNRGSDLRRVPKLPEPCRSLFIEILRLG